MHERKVQQPLLYVGFATTLQDVEEAFRSRQPLVLDGYISNSRFRFDSNGDRLSLSFIVDRHRQDKEKEPWDLARYNFDEYDARVTIDGKTVTAILYLDTFWKKAYVELPL